MRPIIVLGFLILTYSCGQRSRMEIDDMDLVQRSLRRHDPVYGDYLKWTGTDPDSIKTMELVFDGTSKFAIKVYFDDSEFTLKNDQPINFSGQWREEDDKIEMRFYFAPENWHPYLDTIKNSQILRVIDSSTIEIDKTAETIWINEVKCKRTTPSGRVI